MRAHTQRLEASHFFPIAASAELLGARREAVLGGHGRENSDLQHVQAMSSIYLFSISIQRGDSGKLEKVLFSLRSYTERCVGVFHQQCCFDGNSPNRRQQGIEFLRGTNPKVQLL